MTTRIFEGAQQVVDASTFDCLAIEYPVVRGLHAVGMPSRPRLRCLS